MRVVVDASVALKWFFQARRAEADVDAALSLLHGVLDDRITLVQPPHFVSEVCAVLAREMPDDMAAALTDLLDIEMQFVNDEDVYRRAMRLSAELDHHLFDTLYHAVALHDASALLVTADMRYAGRARDAGRIVGLREFHRST